MVNISYTTKIRQLEESTACLPNVIQWIMHALKEKIQKENVFCTKSTHIVKLFIVKTYRTHYLLFRKRRTFTMIEKYLKNV